MERIRSIRNTHLDKYGLDRRTESSEVPATRHKVEKISPEIKKIADSKDGAIEVTSEQKCVREFLSSVDEKVLQDIFAQYFRQTGSVERTMNWTALEDVRIVCKTSEQEEYGDHLTAHYNSRTGITLEAHKLESKVQTLWVLIHEQCHSVTASGWIEESFQEDAETGEMFGKDREMVGLGKTTMITSSKDTEFETVTTKTNEGINEGITELLTERIFREYLTRSGHNIFEPTSANYPDEDKNTWKQIQIEEAVAQQKIDVYGRYWKNARMYIGIISALTDVPADVVEQGLIRAYFRNGSLDFTEESEIAGILDDIHPRLKNVLQNMLNATDEDASFEKVPLWIESNNDIPNDIRQKVFDAANLIISDYNESMDTFINTLE